MLQKPDRHRVEFVWLEVTGRCNLTCTHCYSDSSPFSGHATVGLKRWMSLIGEIHAEGVTTVQFIGGEPTLYPHLPALIRAASNAGLSIEIYTNLLHVSNDLLDLFARNHVRIATSFYSVDSRLHDGITQRPGSYFRTHRNIEAVLRHGLQLRAGIISILPSQNLDAAVEHLRGLGVTDVRVDRLRGVGRGNKASSNRIAELCGACAEGSVAVAASGHVYPCVFARWLPVGNVADESFATIIRGKRLELVRRKLASAFAHRESSCNPSSCSPTNCNPNCTPSSHCTPIQCVPRTKRRRQRTQVVDLTAAVSSGGA
jgi:radical SAM protein with 4Fe4S-binding SPASM domain